ncbi:MAG: flagellar basal body-associated FliL family protein [Bacillota bacterium]
MSEENEQNFKLMLVVMVALSLLIAAGTSYFMLSQLGGSSNGENNDNNSQPVAKVGPTYEVGEFTVNLAKSQRYVSLNMVLEISNEELIKKLENRNPQIRDAVISILRNKSPEDIDAQGKTMELRDEIRKELNKLVADGEITNVFFTKFVMQ